jgi:hypothetical protein
VRPAGRSRKESAVKTLVLRTESVCEAVASDARVMPSRSNIWPKAVEVVGTVPERGGMRAAARRVRSDKGVPGVGGMRVEDVGGCPPHSPLLVSQIFKGDVCFCLVRVDTAVSCFDLFRSRQRPCFLAWIQTFTNSFAALSVWR